MNASTIFFILLVLACPLMMALMMRGGHGHGAHARHREDESDPAGSASTADLRRRQDELDRLIKEREVDERVERC
jgi:hypothetical protein